MLSNGLNAVGFQPCSSHGHTGKQLNKDILYVICHIFIYMIINQCDTMILYLHNLSLSVMRGLSVSDGWLQVSKLAV